MNILVHEGEVQSRVGRRWPVVLVLASLIVLFTFLLVRARSGPSAAPEVVWGQRGSQSGFLARPRAVAIDPQDRLFIVDFTARIQAFDRDGRFLERCWTCPDYRNGRPSGLGIDRQGNLLVADSHYHCVRVYSFDGVELHRFGGTPGSQPGQLGYICDVVQDEEGYYYLGEFGENQRISKFDEAGRFVMCWGRGGMNPGEFGRIRALALGPKDGYLYVADATNHRIQVFTRSGLLVRSWGEAGNEPGRLSYPYDLAFAANGDLYVVERGNHRVQKFSPEGQSLGCWGSLGREPGRLNEPWALAVDSRGRVHVIDTENHRVQRIRF